MEKSLSKLKLILTGDGSHSLFREDLRETYHSIKGAVGESTYVFIKQGISQLNNASIKVLEVGLGTGLNALLTCQYVEENAIDVDYHTLEPFPVQAEVYRQLNYAHDQKSQLIFDQIHACEWGKTIKFNSFFSLTKYLKKLEGFMSPMRYDIIYFDAFAPSKQPDIWAKANLEKCFKLLKPEGILVTYCAQGQFKRDLVAIGFDLEILPGAMGKKEMVRARKSE